MMARVRALLHCIRQRGTLPSRLDAAVEALKRSVEREASAVERVTEKRELERRQTENFRESMAEMIKRIEDGE